MRHLRSTRHRRLIEVCVEARQDAGLSQRELAKRLKRSPSYVSKFEAGERRLEVCEFVDIAEACGINAVELFRRFMA